MCELVNCYRTCIYLELFKKLWVTRPHVVLDSYKDKLGTGHVSHTPDILNLSGERNPPILASCVMQERACSILCAGKAQLLVNGVFVKLPTRCPSV